MERAEALRTARALSDAGIPVVADKRTDFNRGVRVETWGVRARATDGDNYEEREQLPPRWLRILAAVEELDAAYEAYDRHREGHRPHRVSAPCDTCGDLSEAVSEASIKVARVRDDRVGEDGPA